MPIQIEDLETGEVTHYYPGDVRISHQQRMIECKNKDGLVCILAPESVLAGRSAIITSGRRYSLVG